MRVVVQRCLRAEVAVSGKVTARIGQGLVLLVGVTHGDSEEDAAYLADKIAHLRIFEDGDGKMNRSLLETGGEVLSVSQFTLYGDCRKGRRPNFMAAAKPEQAEPLYEKLNDGLRRQGLAVQTGVFGAMMDVGLVNWGPVTLILESR